jgi:hypothetical protein
MALIHIYLFRHPSPFWAKFPHLVIQKRGPCKSYRGVSFDVNGTNSGYFKERKVKFAKFRP